VKPGVFLTAEWRDLAMLNYEVEPSLLHRHVPAGTELDEWNGKNFVSLVGFLFLNTRVRGISIPLHSDFEEVNLRFYVRRKAPDGWRRGVVFIREIVPKLAVATIANIVYNESYSTLPMRHQIALQAGSGGDVQYSWRWRGHWNQLQIKTQGAPQKIAEGSQAEFITEHYWGYAAQRDGGCMEYGVEHPRWRVWQSQAASLECDVAEIYGAEYCHYLNQMPNSAFVAQGSRVVVRRGVRL